MPVSSGIDSKKKRKGKLKKEREAADGENGATLGSDEDEALFSGEEAGDDRPKKVRSANICPFK